MAKAISFIGERGKDFVDIWHSPDSPNEVVKTGDGETYLKFRGGLFVAKNDEEDAAIARAAKNGKYDRSDPNITEPFVCQMPGCNTIWFNQSSYTRHTRFAHTSGMTRK
jgi:hypothetical protein